ncbi:serine hydrolase domain-containing protein [Kordiimonas aestuarii]|uniref:serine hydrolase domain-containing protein n=1 Tax=Kordiimonas aestuarii TaxID=1005925 RepID=UPI0021D33C47|nr:serine hydrolase domain-containing protein [Kordiimonas aestuarii]
MRSIIISVVMGITLLGPSALRASDWTPTSKEAQAELGQADVALYKVGALGKEESFGQGALKSTTPLRIASVTKTYVAATALRLWEEDKLELGVPIACYIDPAFATIIAEDGYDADEITVRHLMSHTSGMADHAQTQTFFDTIIKDPTHAWTREEDLRGLVDWTEPKGKPGERFSYSDTGYILLGHIIERQTGMTLAAAVRQHLGLDAIGLPDTYWEIMEKGEGIANRRAHQMLNGLDTFGWSASLDLYGGGGIVSSPRDMARFFQALFSGKVFKKPGTLEVMLSPQGLPSGSPYRLGVFVKEHDGTTYYEHSGFWGTLAIYNPATGVALSGSVTDKTHFPAMRAALLAALQN